LAGLTRATLATECLGVRGVMHWPREGRNEGGSVSSELVYFYQEPDASVSDSCRLHQQQIPLRLRFVRGRVWDADTAWMSASAGARWVPICLESAA